ncbi:MAG: hypothetical protein KDJ16_15330 [Hyphomicrobiales bacterium]|nr:hypothetical protein [Hyphomicrobiales bacterium]
MTPITYFAVRISVGVPPLQSPLVGYHQRSTLDPQRIMPDNIAEWQKLGKDSKLIFPCRGHGLDFARLPIHVSPDMAA